MLQDKVEILLATYNGGKYLPAQLDSLFAQTYTNWRLLIRDDGSTDNTLQIIENYRLMYPEKIKLIPSDGQNLRSTFNFSKLLEASSEEYVMLCDQDDVWKNTKMELSINELKKMEQQYGAEKPLLVFTDLTIVDEQLQTIHPSFFKLRKQDTEIIKSWYKLIAHSTITGCTIAMNRAAVNVSAPIRINNFQHDHWIGMHVAYYGHIHYLNIPTVLYRQHTQNSVGAQKISGKYLASRLTYFPLLIRDWILLKKTSRIKIPIIKIFAFKVYYNLKRLLS